MNTSWTKRWGFPVLAAGLAGAMLPLGGLAPAAGAGPGEPATPAFSGYSSTATSSPVKIEIFEPTIPIPSSPQLELLLGYTKVKADSSSSKGRASWLWPGDAVGEGLKTIVDQAGLPSQLGEAGYPIQVNSTYPSGTATEAQEPFPGVVMRTTSADKKAEASVGYSTNCNVADGDAGESASPLPGLPDLPALPGLEGLTEVLDGLTGLTGRQAPAPATASTSGSSDPSGAEDTTRTGAPETPCQLPDALAAVVDIGGYVSDTASEAGAEKVTTTARAALGDVKLIGGLITMSGITAKAVSSSDGQAGTTRGRADYGTMTIAGETFAIGPEGFVAADQTGDIPGLPDDPTGALATLGVTVTVPQPSYKVTGDKAVGTVEGLIVTIDMKTLAPVLRELPLSTILDAIPFPAEAKQLKNALGAAGNLSPKFVVHLGFATSTVDTVQPFAIPDSVPDNDPGGDGDGGTAEGEGSDGEQSAAGGTSGSGTGSVAPAATAPADATTGAADPALTDASLASGLPALFSIPGALMLGAIAGALVAGSYVRRIGALALGGAGSCSHGLDSGLPDLRKVQ